MFYHPVRNDHTVLNFWPIVKDATGLKLIFTLFENVRKLRNALGGGGLKIVTEAYIAEGICRVLRYGKPNSALRNLRMFFFQPLWV